MKSLSHVWLFMTPWIVLEWIAIAFSRGSSQPRDRTLMSRIAGRCFTVWATREALSDSSVHGIFQAIVLEWIAISFSRGSSWPRDQTQVSCIVDRCFTIWATREVLEGINSRKREAEEWISEMGDTCWKSLLRNTIKEWKEIKAI